MVQPCLVILCTLAFDVRHHHVQRMALARQRRRGAAHATARRRRRHYSDEDEAHGRQQDQAPLLSRVSEWPRKPKESL